jgi:hypothetical protein
MSRITTINDCKLIELPRIHSNLGSITPIENSEQVPFDVKRIYYLYDVPGGASRAAHGHKQLEQLIVAASGSFDITLDDGVNKRKFQLNRPYWGLHVKPGLWRDIDNFSSGSICLVLASELYSEDDYFREYDEFVKYKTI